MPPIRSAVLATRLWAVYRVSLHDSNQASLFWLGNYSGCDHRAALSQARHDWFPIGQGVFDLWAKEISFAAFHNDEHLRQ